MRSPRPISNPSGNFWLDDGIAGLESLTTLSQSQVRLVDVDLSSIAGDVLSRLQERDRRRVVVTHLQDGLRTSGDAGLLRTLVELLLGSAWKLTQRTRMATITFTRTHNRTASPFFA